MIEKPISLPIAGIVAVIVWALSAFIPATVTLLALVAIVAAFGQPFSLYYKKYAAGKVEWE